MRDRARNSVRGRVAKAAGDVFETWIENQHVEAMRLGILAHVEKTEPHAKYIRGKLEFVKKGVADYVGTLEGGHSLAVEAKSTADDRLPRSAVSEKQQEHLDAVARAGGLALLLVEFRFLIGEPKGRAFVCSDSYSRFAIPWLEVPWVRLKTVDSISSLGVVDWLVQPPCYLLRWHQGGPRSSNHGLRKRVFPRE